MFNIELDPRSTLMNAILHAIDDDTPHRIELTVQIRPTDMSYCNSRTTARSRSAGTRRSNAARVH